MRPTSSLPRRSSNKAAALIIVLAFVVLLTGLSVAYLSRATTDRQLAHTSFHDTDADLLARSALDIVIGDFKQEIENGSSVLNVAGTTVFSPTSSANVVPMRNSPTPIPNLIRISVSGDPGITAPAVGSRASAVSSTSQSANGRSISTTRWNKHCLLPTVSGATIDNPIPTPSFTPPDWVLVTRAGPVAFSGFIPGLKDPTSTNTTYAVGRYAYAVYDEGGLLDINVAGYPSPTPAALPPSAPSVRDVGRKGVLAFADLTALPTTPGNYMSTTAINTLIGFRNYATMQLSGVSGLNFSPFPPSAVSNFFNYFTMPIPIPAASPLQIGTSKDFGVVNSVGTGLLSDSSIRTDQNFISRAEFINFFKSSGIANVNTLQYLGTFSREQNKPTLPLTPTSMWPFTRVVLPQRFYLGNLNNIWGSLGAGGPSWLASPPTASQATNIQTYLGLQFASAGGDSPCDNQVRWKYVGQSGNTPLSAIPAFPGIFTTTSLDLFQYINYALWGVTTADSNSTHIASTLQIGASIIDQYDDDLLTTGIYFGSNPATCDTDPPINACLVYGADAGSAPPPPLPCVSSSPPYVPSNVFANRPLRTVGECSYAYNLLDAINNNNGSHYLTDFKDTYNSTSNPDPALLDLFTYNSAPVRSGIVSLNTRQPPVLAAILQGAIYRNSDSSVVSNSDASTAANSIVNETSNFTPPHGPALSRADIARLASVVPSLTFNSDEEGKDTIARALSEVVQTRTWGLLIDVVAQTGHYKPDAPGLADFIVEGEKRYWLHIAIDRFDGTIVGQQLEEVIE